jgi:rhomboid family protein
MAIEQHARRRPRVRVGLDRLPLPLERPGWDGVAPAVGGYLRTTPVTCVYAFVLLITTWVLQTSSARVANQLLLERSTNLYQLARDPVRVIVESAFWLSSTWQVFPWLALLFAIVAFAERRVGSLRVVGVLAAGHVGATLLTAAGLWLALRADAIERSVVYARDVGPSYAFFAAAAFLTYLLPRRLRAPYAAILLAYGCATAVVSTTFTDFGHLLAIGIGFACYPLLRGVRPRPASVGSTTEG